MTYFRIISVAVLSFSMIAPALAEGTTSGRAQGYRVADRMSQQDRIRFGYSNRHPTNNSAWGGLYDPPLGDRGEPHRAPDYHLHGAGGGLKFGL